MFGLLGENGTDIISAPGLGKPYEYYVINGSLVNGIVDQALEGKEVPEEDRLIHLTKPTSGKVATVYTNKGLPVYIKDQDIEDCRGAVASKKCATVRKVVIIGTDPIEAPKEVLKKLTGKPFVK